MYITQLAAVEKLRDLQHPCTIFTAALSAEDKRPAALERCKAVAGLSLGDFAPRRRSDREARLKRTRLLAAPRLR